MRVVLCLLAVIAVAGCSELELLPPEDDDGRSAGINTGISGGDEEPTDDGVDVITETLPGDNVRDDDV